MARGLAVNFIFDGHEFHVEVIENHIRVTDRTENTSFSVLPSCDPMDALLGYLDQFTLVA